MARHCYCSACAAHSNIDIRHPREPRAYTTSPKPRGRIATYGREGISNALDNLLLVFLLSCLFSPLLPYCPLFFYCFFLSYILILMFYYMSLLACQNVAILFLSFNFYLYIFIHFMCIDIYLRTSTYNIITVNIF